MKQLKLNITILFSFNNTKTWYSTSFLNINKRFDSRLYIRAINKRNKLPTILTKVYCTILYTIFKPLNL